MIQVYIKEVDRIEILYMIEGAIMQFLSLERQEVRKEMFLAFLKY